MAASTRSFVAHWTVVVPVLAVVALALTWGRELPGVVRVVVAAFLAGAVLAAVHHAEVIALRVGEPFGSLARDTVFAAVMITCNGILGLSLLLGALRRRVAVFNPEGTAPRSRPWRRSPR